MFIPHSTIVLTDKFTQHIMYFDNFLCKFWLPFNIFKLSSNYLTVWRKLALLSHHLWKTRYRFKCISMWYSCSMYCTILFSFWICPFLMSVFLKRKFAYTRLEYFESIRVCTCTLILYDYEMCLCACRLSVVISYSISFKRDCAFAYILVTIFA